MLNLPSFDTKSKPALKYHLLPSELQLTILQNDGSNETGSTLWLSAQIMSVYLQMHGMKHVRKVVELGAGTGLLSLTCANVLGCQVIATDIATVLPLLCANIKENTSTGGFHGSVQARTLDWNHLDHAVVEDLHDVDLIISSDTVYEPTLFQPLLTTLKAIFDISGSSHSSNRPPCDVLLGLERRDPAAIDAFFKLARENGWQSRPVEQQKIDECGQVLRWRADDWEGIEIWSMTYP